MKHVIEWLKDAGSWMFKQIKPIVIIMKMIFEIIVHEITTFNWNTHMNLHGDRGNHDIFQTEIFQWFFSPPSPFSSKVSSSLFTPSTWRITMTTFSWQKMAASLSHWLDSLVQKGPRQLTLACTGTSGPSCASFLTSLYHCRGSTSLSQVWRHRRLLCERRCMGGCRWVYTQDD